MRVTRPSARQPEPAPHKAVRRPRTRIDPHRCRESRFFDEALTDAARYAHASHVDIRIAARKDKVEPRVRDDGPAPDQRVRSAGLANILASAERLGGNVTWLPNKPNGTIIKWRVPYASTPASDPVLDSGTARLTGCQLGPAGVMDTHEQNSGLVSHQPFAVRFHDLRHAHASWPVSPTAPTSKS